MTKLRVLRVDAMKSWSYFIWFKRLAPFALLALLWLGYVKIDHYLDERQAQFEDKVALVTAHVWLAGAKYRNEPLRFQQYRDSVLTANHLTIDELQKYASKYPNEPEKYERVASLTAQYVDSIYEIEESLRQVNEDTSAAPDPKKADGSDSSE